MKSKNKHNRAKSREQESAIATISSMMFSLFLVGLSLLFVVGFRYYLRGHTYDGQSHKKKEIHKSNGDILTLDESFEVEYLMVKNVAEGESFCSTLEPGRITEESEALSNGQILEVKQKGSYKGRDYYRLKDNNYVLADNSKIIELKEYLPLNGYIAITYISSGGVRMRSWADFDADNVVKSVYVGDKVDIVAMVETMDGTSAFQTSDGSYITTDPTYFTDYTNLAQMTTEASTQTDAAPEAATELPSEQEVTGDPVTQTEEVPAQ